MSVGLGLSADVSGARVDAGLDRCARLVEMGMRC